MWSSVEVNLPRKFVVKFLNNSKNLLLSWSTTHIWIPVNTDSIILNSYKGEKKIKIIVPVCSAWDWHIDIYIAAVKRCVWNSIYRHIVTITKILCGEFTNYYTYILSWQSACTNTDLFKWIKRKTKLKDLYTLFEAKMASNSGPSSGESTPKLFRAHAKGT